MNHIMKKELKDLILENVSTDDTFEDSGELYEHLKYSGSFLKIIDSSRDTHYRDLRRWALHNYDYIIEAIADECFTGENTVYQLIRCGQYSALEQEATELLDEIFEECKGKLFNIEFDEV